MELWLCECVFFFFLGEVCGESDGLYWLALLLGYGLFYDFGF